MENRPKVKILVGYHKPATLIKDDVFVPIHLGRALATEASKDGKMSNEDYQWMLDNMIGDDTGENISEQNRYLNEMTAIFWAWKNYDKLGNPEYFGFCHYRRVLDFNGASKNLPINPLLGIPNLEHLSSNSEFINTENIYKTVAKNEYIISKHHQINPIFHFNNVDYLNVEDYNLAISLLKKYCPQYSQYADIYNQGNKCYFCNIFIMPKAEFFQYAEYMFKILFELSEKIDRRNYSIRQERMAAYISEWLTGIYFTYLNSKKNILELPMVYIKNTDLKPIIKQENKDEISVVMSSDDNYVPYLATTIQSIISNSNPEKYYKIYVLNVKLQEYNIQRVLSMQTKNVHIQFVDVSSYLQNYDKSLWFEYRHFTQAVYYRFFIPEIFINFKKIVYCDCDAVFLDDVAQLYRIDLENNIIGAVSDIEINKQLFTNDNSEYYCKVLKLKNPNNYFNSGLMIFNIFECNKFNLIDKCIKTLKNIKTPYTVDQDIFNIVCEDRVKFLDLSWNVENHVLLENPNLQDLLPANIYHEYKKSLVNAKFLHFSSSLKPWQNPSSFNAHLFWKYAKMSDYYEQIIYENEHNNHSKSDMPKQEKTLRLTFFEKIFSLKNHSTNNKKYKVITILGIKIKIRRGKK